MSKPNSFGAECSPDLIRRGYKMMMKEKDPVWEILSDPDWVAWLGDKPHSHTFEAVVDYDDYNQPNINCQEALADGWKIGDRVRVTLEKIE